ncbi:MAG: hypothetical protein NZM16_09940 [Thermoflexus sp.]|uniref:hypothetical protein n=1 Tax=Thermoflexus sp. TaxID=1969742 RepID=UPI0025DAF5EC|nr:hypothetical protein [Thermoflexus sp.]MCS6964352.1 hypothetical protein [Thermoflexus sp.]
MELGEWLSRGLQLTWRYKTLWIFGFLAALGVGGSPRVSGRLNLGVQTPPPSFAPGFERMLQRWLEQNWPLLVLAFLGFFLFALLIQLVALWGQGALILGSGEAAEGRSPALGALARQAAARLLRLIGIMVLLGAPGFLITLILLLAILVGFLLAFAQGAEAIRIATLLVAILTALVLLGCLLLLAGALHLWSRLALRAALLEDLPWLRALRRSFQIGMRRIGPLLLVWLVLDIGVLGTTTFILSILAAIPLLAVGSLAFLAFFGGGGPVDPSAIFRFALGIALAALCISVLIPLLLGPVITFVETVWTLAYRSWIGSSPAAGERPSAI